MGNALADALARPPRLTTRAGATTQALRMTLAQLVETDTSPGKQAYRRGAARSRRGATKAKKPARLTRAAPRAGPPPAAHPRSFLYQFALDNSPVDR